MKSSSATEVGTEFQQMVMTHLKLLTPDLVAVLKRLIEHEYPKEVFLISFDVFSDKFASSFPVKTHFMDAEGNEYFISDEQGQKRSPIPEGLSVGLLEIKEVYPKGLEGQFEDRAPEIDCRDLATRILIGWFAYCWTKAGGLSFKRQVIISNYDDNKGYNLMTYNWQELDSSYEQ